MMPNQVSLANIQDSLTNFELTLLKEEYFFLQKTIEDYSKQIWLIKALGITGTSSVVALAEQQKEAEIILLGCAIPIFFWILESQWKHFQRGFYPRVEQIENILSVSYKLKSPLIFGSWCRSFNRKFPKNRRGYLWDGFLNPSVFVSYWLELTFLLTVWCFQVID